MVGWKKGSTASSTDNNDTTTMKLKEFAKYIPLRLGPEERQLLNILNNTLEVSEYTDHVDVASNRRGLKARRILDGILEACHISTGLAVCSGREHRVLGSVVAAAAVQESSVEETATTTKTTTAAAAAAAASSRTSTQKQEQEEEEDDDALLPSSKKKKKKKKQKKLTKKEKKRQNRLLKKKQIASSSSLLPPPSSSWASRDPKSNAALFQAMFEIGRRNKVLNPSSMRTTYGKLMYLLQDSQNPTVSKSLGFSLYKDLVLVGPYLEEHNTESLLDDERLVGATEYIRTVDEGGERLPRDTIAARVALKRALQDELVDTYSSSSNANRLSADNVRRVIDSVADAVAYVESNVTPVHQMLQYLEDNFDPTTVKDGFSLQLSGSSRSYSSSSSSSYGRYGWSAFRENSGGGATLSHSHSTQYTFVWQSLRLWCKVMRHMHQLWVCADDDLLSTSTTYHLYNTGQGLNRVQSCPRVGRVMRSLLSQTQQEAGAPWVGLSVVHLGDRDVPNALVFIDKYTQIPRFLHPIVEFIQGLPELCQDERIDAYVKEQFGTQERLKMMVLTDYFRHGFDGSGDDGGSCIDGRLTSSWNWTSRIVKKRYYHAFMLSGFQGFDGDFK